MGSQNQLTRPRAARAITIPAALVAIGVLASGVALAAGSGISVHVSPNPVYYVSANQADIAGHLASGKSNVLVRLQKREWPFEGSFQSAKDKLTGNHGRFTFRQNPSLATQYQVVAPSSSAHSNVHTVFVMPGYANLHCTITDSHGNVYTCQTHTHRNAGNYTLHFSFDYLYPGSAYNYEKGKRVYPYYGQRNGQQEPPSTLTLQGTVSQHELSGNRTHVSIDQPISIPSTAWDFQITACTRTSVHDDGLGLRGPPGSHHCGDKTITYSQSQGPLG